MMGPTCFVILFALAQAGGSARADRPGGQAKIAPASSIEVTCAFTNPVYAGACVQLTTRTEEQKPAAACKPILDCLNNPLCVRTYCRATTVRRGWQLLSAQ